MNTLTVWKFRGPQSAESQLPRLRRLAAQGLIGIDDAAVVSWPEGARKPSIRSLGSLTGPGQLWGGFWGVLLGLIFLVPIAGPAFGAAAGAIAGSLSDFGIEDDFIKRVRETVTPGASGLFVLSSDTVADRLKAEMGGREIALIRCDLTPEHERRLRDTLGEEFEKSAS